MAKLLELASSRDARVGRTAGCRKRWVSHRGRSASAEPGGAPLEDCPSMVAQVRAVARAGASPVVRTRLRGAPATAPVDRPRGRQSHPTSGYPGGSPSDGDRADELAEAPAAAARPALAQTGPAGGRRLLKLDSRQSLGGSCLTREPSSARCCHPAGGGNHSLRPRPGPARCLLDPHDPIREGPRGNRSGPCPPAP